MGNDTILVNTTTWTSSSSTTATGKTDSHDLASDLVKTLGDFVNEMAPIFFLSSMRNLMTAVEDFGQGMSAALACVSTDLQVVSSGLSSAAAAFAATDKELANTFAQLDTQLAYYTNTMTSTTLATPTAADDAALTAAYQQYYQLDPNTTDGWTLSHQQIQDLQKNNAKAAATTGVGVVVVVIICICLLPFGI